MVLNDARKIAEAAHENMGVNPKFENHLRWLQRRNSDDPHAFPSVEMYELRLPPGDVNLLIRADNEYRNEQGK